MKERTIRVALWAVFSWAALLYGGVAETEVETSSGSGMNRLETLLSAGWTKANTTGWEAPEGRVETTSIYPADFQREKISRYRRGAIQERKKFPPVKAAPQYSEFLKRLEEERNAEEEQAEGERESTEEETAAKEEKPIQTEASMEGSDRGEGGLDRSEDAPLTQEEKILLQGPLFPRPYERTFSTERLLLYFPVPVEGEAGGNGARILVPVEAGVPFIPPTREYPRSRAEIKQVP